MEDQALLIFAREQSAPPLRTLGSALRAAGYPTEIGVGIAGAATDAELNALDWEAAFVRWTEPELHEVYLLERDVVGEDELADKAVLNALRAAVGHPDEAGRLIVVDQLRRTRVVYACQILPALLEDEDHPAWAALDVVLRALAGDANGLIYAEAEGFYDADGELMLAELEALEADSDAEPDF